MELWGFLWVMFALKIPLAMLLWLVWWAAHQTPEEPGGDDSDGGLRRRHRQPRPRDPRRRGPHGGDAAIPAPPRTRVSARARRRASR